MNYIETILYQERLGSETNKPLGKISRVPVSATVTEFLVSFSFCVLSVIAFLVVIF